MTMVERPPLLSPDTVSERRFWRALREFPRTGVLVLLILVSVSLLTPLFVPESRVIDGDLARRGLAPWSFGERPDTSWWAIFGTDAQGRDVALRMIYGIRTSLAVATASIAFGGLIGSALGLLSGYRGGWLDAVLMRFVDIMISMPVILIALVAAATFTQSFLSVAIIIGFIVLPRYARQVRGDVLKVKSEDFVQLARINGCSHWRVSVVHILPNLMSGIVVLTSLQLGWAILIEASLSFLGAGLPAPAPTLGGMISEGQEYLDSWWWISIIPGSLLAVFVLCFNYIGDHLRDRLDPHFSA